MNIHAIIKEVSKHYTMPVKTGCYGYQFTAPDDITKPKNACITIRVSGSYNKVLAERRSYIAHDVVILATQDNDKALYAMYDVSEHDFSIAEAIKRNIV